MHSRVIVLFALFATLNSYFQNDYEILYERHVIGYINEMYGRVNVSYNKVNRTTRRLLVTVDVFRDVGNDLMFVLQVMKFTNNEYRLFPVRYEERPCSNIFEPVFGFNYKNFDNNVTVCPFKKGTYYIRDVTFDQSKFPPFAPRGRYEFIMMLYADNYTLLGNISVYLKVIPTNRLEVEH